jgi:hypothetical protein
MAPDLPQRRLHRFADQPPGAQRRDHRLISTRSSNRRSPQRPALSPQRSGDYLARAL